MAPARLRDRLPSPPAGGEALRRFRYEYGAEPMHLLAAAATLFLAAYALLRIVEIPSTGAILLWLGGAIVLHDFVLLPVYSLLERIARGAIAPISPRWRMALTLNHVRVPVGLSLLLLLIWFPLVLRVDQRRYEIITGLSPDVFLGRWLLLSGLLFAGSAVLYALRLRRLRGRPDRSGSRPGPAKPGDAAPSLGMRVATAAWSAIVGLGLLLFLWVAVTAVGGLISSGP